MIRDRRFVATAVLVVGILWALAMAGSSLLPSMSPAPVAALELTGPESLRNDLPQQPDTESQTFVATLPNDLQASVHRWTDFVRTNFAGDAACAECHRRQYEAHLRSGHSRTLTRMNDSELAKRLVEVGSYRDPRRDQTFEFNREEGEFLVQDTKNVPGVAIPVTWLLGSGTHAQTPIAVDERTQTGVEMRWSSIRGHGTVDVTPDHERFDSFSAGTIECFGRPLDSADIRSCLGCHSTVTPPPSLPMIHSLVVANVGCERCHGPRQRHVEMADAGLAEQVKPMIQYESAESYMDACASCHRDESSVRPDAPDHELARFQPYGIKRSRCYLQSSGKLTCSTCHDPHDTVSHDRSRSIQQCQQCHGNGESEITSGDPQTVCSHQPQGDCIECHMPSTVWSSGIAFHDHWIRIPNHNE